MLISSRDGRRVYNEIINLIDKKKIRLNDA